MKNLRYDITCAMCPTVFKSNQPKVKFCGDLCRKKAHEYVSGRYASEQLPSGTVGAIAEMYMGADLLRRGYSVFRALSPSCFCDLVAFKNDKVEYVEVRTGYRSLGGKTTFPKKLHGPATMYAIFERNSGECLYFDLNLKEIHP